MGAVTGYSCDYCDKAIKPDEVAAMVRVILTGHGDVYTCGWEHAAAYCTAQLAPVTPKPKPKALAVGRRRGGQRGEKRDRTAE